MKANLYENFLKQQNQLISADQNGFLFTLGIMSMIRNNFTLSQKFMPYPMQIQQYTKPLSQSQLQQNPKYLIITSYNITHKKIMDIPSQKQPQNSKKTNQQQKSEHHDNKCQAVDQWKNCKEQFQSVSMEMDMNMAGEGQDKDGLEGVIKRVESSVGHDNNDSKSILDESKFMESSVLAKSSHRYMPRPPKLQLLRCPSHNTEIPTTQIFICLQKSCPLSHSHPHSNINPTSSLHSRLLCTQCINQQLHRGHLVCTLIRLQKLYNEHYEASERVMEVLMGKIGELRYRFEVYMEEFAKKVRQIIQHLPVGVKENCQSNKYQNLQQFLTLSIFPEILTPSPQCSQPTAIEKLLHFQQTSISQQIENIYNNFEQSIKESLSNIEFINQHTDLVFNPDDMHADEIGLTLDRNRIEVVDMDNKSSRVSGIHGQQGEEKGQTKAVCKLAFTQTQLRSEQTRSFKVNGIREQIVIGCVDAEGHDKIASDPYYYKNCESEIYGISIKSTGQMTLHNKNKSPLPLTDLSPCVKGDIISLSFNTKQNTLTITHHTVQNNNIINQVKSISQFSNKNESTFINYSKTILGILTIGPIQDEVCYPFVGVCVEGDCVGLVANIEHQGQANGMVKVNGKEIYEKNDYSVQQQKQKELKIEKQKQKMRARSPRSKITALKQKQKQKK